MNCHKKLSFCCLAGLPFTRMSCDLTTNQQQIILQLNLWKFCVLPNDYITAYPSQQIQTFLNWIASKTFLLLSGRSTLHTNVLWFDHKSTLNHITIEFMKVLHISKWLHHCLSSLTNWNFSLLNCHKKLSFLLSSWYNTLHECLVIWPQISSESYYNWIYESFAYF